MNITTLDSALNNVPVSERPELTKPIPQPVSVEQFIAENRPAPINREQSFCFLDAVMLGLEFKLKTSDGEVLHFNQGSPNKLTALRDNDLSSVGNVGDNEQLLMLKNVEKAVLQNCQTFSAQDFWDFGKVGGFLDYKTVIDYAVKRLAELKEAGQIKELNSHWDFIVYGK